MLPDNYSGSKFDARKPSVTSSVRHHHRRRRRRRQEKEREKHANRFDSNRIVSLFLFKTVVVRHNAAAQK